MYRFIFILALVLFSFSTLIGQDRSDEDGIKAAILDYSEGWNTGDAERMEKALHPDLAKRRVTYSKDGKWAKLDQMSALTLIQYTRQGYGKKTPENERQMEITIYDIYGNTATAKTISKDWIDYMHLAKWNGEWKIVNVLWELKPGLEKK